jgi:GH25 family lysozyme M1 (1,4-beta-N-acetylmuramidase)
VSLATGIVETVLGEVPDYGGAIAGAGLQGYTSDVAYGCDISFWNVNDTSYAKGSTLDDSAADYSLVDFDRMKADGCDFVILRIGSADSSGNYYDPHFVTLYNMAREAGMDIGLYFYSDALTYAGAVAEAEFVISVIEAYDMYFEYPLYIDIEESDQLALGTTGLDNLCYGWCETMIEAGYFPGIYGNYNLYEKLSSDIIDNYDFWLAYVSSSTSMSSYNPNNMNLSDECSMWQYSFYGYEYDGIGKEMLDVNVSYKDYPSIMKNGGYNNLP